MMQILRDATRADLERAAALVHPLMADHQLDLQTGACSCGHVSDPPKVGVHAAHVVSVLTGTPPADVLKSVGYRDPA